MANKTHKTIIFEEFDSSNSNNLYTILNNKPSTDGLSRGLSELTVSSFDEFMKKFAPKVYEVCRKNPETGNIEFFYTTDPKKFSDLPYNEIDIGEHIYYKMLSQLYASKGTSGKANLQFKDEEFLEMLTPKKELDEVRDTRQKIEYNLQNFYEAKARGDKSAMNEANKNIQDCRKKIAGYAKSPLNKLLPILIEDTNKKLEVLEIATGGVTGSDTKSLSAANFGVLYLNPAGQLDIDENWKASDAKQLAAPEAQKNGASVAVKENLPAKVQKIPAPISNPVPDKKNLSNTIAATIEKDYDKNAKIPNEQVKAMIVSAFAPLAVSSNSENTKEVVDKETLLARRQVFEVAYTNARKSFIKEMSRMIESLLGVKAFFDHATIDGGENSEIPGGVIIANCKASKLLNNKDVFSYYMKYLGKAQTEARIWFAIVPSVFENPPVKNSDEKISDDDPMGGSLNDDEEDAAEKISAEYVSINALKEFLKVMEDAKITTVFNIRSDKGNTFADLSAAGVEDKIKTFESCRYGHSVYAYPNFTLIGEKIFKPFEGQNDAEIILPGIFIDAAYPAAGLLVASQQQKILDSRKLKVDKDTACVGVDLENLTVKKALSTKFNRESVLRRSEDLIKVINENMFGFAFSGDEVKDDSGVWQNSYIHCARTLAKNERTGNYKPIYQTLIEDFITQELMSLPSKKKDDVQKKINKINSEWSDKNKQIKFKDIVNFLLRDGEEIEINSEDSKVKIKIHFSGGDSYVDVDVESD